MLPYRDEAEAYNPSWDQGLDILPALDLAAEHINGNSSILPCHRLELFHVDGGCDIVPKTSLGIVNGLFSKPNSESVIGAVGPGCSVSAVAMSEIVNNPNVDMVILHDAGSPLLTNRTTYKNSVGILGSTQPFVDLSLALMDEVGWRHIAILYESTRLYYRSTTENFINKMTGVKILFQAAVFPTFYPLNELRNSLARIVFLFMSPENSRRILCLAYHEGMVYPGYQWIIASRRLDDFKTNISFDYDRRQYHCSSDILLSIALEKVFLMGFQLATEQTRGNVNSLADITFSQFVQEYEDKVSAYNNNSNNSSDKLSPTYWAYNMYDAVWAWALVLHNLICRLEFEKGSETLADRILDEFYSINFQGMSGRISFNSSNGFINRQTNLFQIVNGSEVFVTATDGTGVVGFQMGSYDTIPDIVRVVGLPHIQLVGFFFILQCLEFFVVITLHTCTVVYRKSKSVKASSTQLSHFVFLGLYLLISATIVLSVAEINEFNPKINGIFCQTIWAWLLPLSFTLIVGTVAVRTWRLYRIFTHYLNPGRFISTQVLIMVLSSLLFLDILIAVVLTAADPMREVLVNFMIENGTANELMQDRMCIPNYLLLWFVLIHGYKLVLLGFVAMLTFLTRTIPNKTFATSSLVVFSYIFLIVYMFGFIIFYLILYTGITHNPNADYSTLSVMFNTMICLIIACIAAPPLVPVARGKMEKYFHNRILSSIHLSDSKKNGLL
jgi:ABC-type branched-subunit amino acid transport system substrate-binding protein